MSAKIYVKVGVIVGVGESKEELEQFLFRSEEHSFNDAMKIDGLERTFSLALICLSEKTIDYLAIAKKGNRVGDTKNLITFFSAINLEKLSFDEIKNAIPSASRNHFHPSVRGLAKVIPEGTLEKVIGQIRQMRPTLAEEIEKTATLSSIAGYRFSGANADFLSLERECIGMSLQIFTGSNKLRERVLRNWTPNEAQIETLDHTGKEASLNSSAPSTSYLTQLNVPIVPIDEESAIQHDLMNWLNQVGTYECGKTVFNSGNRTLEVIYANKNSLETSLGVDLIYIHDAYGAVTLVQYKLMKFENGKYGFRPDTKSDDQLKRMSDFFKDNSPSRSIDRSEDYRLAADGFFFKLVPARGVIATSGELLSGLYIPRELMGFYSGKDGLKGKNGGRCIDFDNCKRYFTNTQFADLVDAGWVGTSSLSTDKIRKLIQERFGQSNGVIVSIEKCSSNRSRDQIL